MANPGLTKAYLADVDIAPYLILKQGSDDAHATIAAAATDRLIGVSENVSVAAGRCVDCVLGGIAAVTAGGTVAAGDYLTSDSQGRAITATAGTGRIIGQAFESAVVGDVFRVTIQFGKA